MQNPDLGSPDRLNAALAHLTQTIDARSANLLSNDAKTSYTAKLLREGPPACAAKVDEEGKELADAIRGESDAEVASEAADVLYHMLVALRARGVPLDTVAAALESRQGTSGLDEKASR
jgi:phosphoribosyl-ATP pyrophosphohydrolase